MLSDKKDIEYLKYENGKTVYVTHTTITDEDYKRTKKEKEVENNFTNNFYSRLIKLEENKQLFIFKITNGKGTKHIRENRFIDIIKKVAKKANKKNCKSIFIETPYGMLYIFRTKKEKEPYSEVKIYDTSGKEAKEIKPSLVRYVI